MSKLSKFKPTITAEEAAVLLSRLINEKVSAKDIQNLHEHGWLYANYTCLATLVKLKHECSDDMNGTASISGPHFVTEEMDCGLCVGLDLPLGDIFINKEHLSYSLFDLEGNEYGIRENDTNQYINRLNYHQLCSTDAGFYPNEIYELAALANNDLAVEHPELKVLKNNYCLSEIEVYNFQPNSDKKLLHALATERLPQSEPPSYVLAVAALVEIITNGGSRNHNQSSLIEEILEKYELRGLSKSNLEKMFSQAKRKLSEAQATKG